MANVITEIHAILAATVGVTSLVPASRIEAIRVNSKTKVVRPNIVIRHPGSEPRWGALAADDGIHRPNIAIDCYSSTSSLQAHSVGEAVRTALQRVGPVTQVADELLDVTFEDESEDWDDDENCYVMRFDLACMIRE
jgi:hypothetical protein